MLDSDNFSQGIRPKTGASEEDIILDDDDPDNALKRVPFRLGEDGKKGSERSSGTILSKEENPEEQT